MAHDDGDTESRVIFALVTTAVAIEEVGARLTGHPRVGELGQVDVDEAELLVRFAAFQLLQSIRKYKRSISRIDRRE